MSLFLLKNHTLHKQTLLQLSPIFVHLVIAMVTSHEGLPFFWREKNIDQYVYLSVDRQNNTVLSEMSYLEMSWGKEIMERKDKLHQLHLLPFKSLWCIYLVHLKKAETLTKRITFTLSESGKLVFRDLATSGECVVWFSVFGARYVSGAPLMNSQPFRFATYSMQSPCNGCIIETLNALVRLQACKMLPLNIVT